MSAVIDSVMLSRYYTRDTRTDILEDLQETISRTMRTLGTVRNGNSVTKVTVLPAFIESVNPDGSGAGKFIVTATGSPAFLDFLKAQFNVETMRKGGLSSSWKIVMKRPIRIAPTVNIAQAATLDENGNTSVIRNGQPWGMPHPPTARFATSDTNAARATNSNRILTTFRDTPRLPVLPGQRQVEDVMRVLNLEEDIKAQLRASVVIQWNTVRTVLLRAIERELARQQSGSANAAAAFAGATGSMDPAARAAAARSAAAAAAALNVNARALRLTDRHAIPPEDMALLAPEGAAGGGGGAAGGGYRRTKKRKTNRRQIKRRKTKNRRTH